MDKVSIQLENVNFWKQFIEESEKSGTMIHPRMRKKLLQAEEKLLVSLLEKHNHMNGSGEAYLISRTIH